MEPPRALPDIDFATFVLSLASSALMHLGEMPEGEGQEPVRDLALAKQTIDILAMLEAKTRGNLDEGEDKLLKSVIYDLRVNYVDAQKQG
jgi:hypothetical protein